MSDRDGVTRRGFVGGALTGIGAITVTGGMSDLLLGCAAPQRPGAGPTASIGHFAALGVDERMIREALAAAMSRGADHADLFFQHRVLSNVGLQDGAVNRASRNVELGVGVRVVKGDQTGFSYTEELSVDALRSAAKTAAAIADGPARPAPARFHLVKGLPSRYRISLSGADVGPAAGLPILEELNAAGFRADKRIVKVSAQMSEDHTVILIADHTGRLIEDVQPMTRLYMSCVAESEGKRESNGYNVAARAGLDFYTRDRLDRIVREAVARTTILFSAVQPPAGSLPVVLAAGASGILLHEAIGHGMEADFNRRGTSIYSDKLGKPVAKPFVNVIDEGTMAQARGAINVDDEGNIPGKTMLVENGVLTSYLHDSISARHYKVQPTGNGRRESYRHAPLPRMRATYMLPGPHRADEIIASVKNGIFCANFANGQVNIGGGDFTFYVKNGYLIEDGKLTRPIKDINLIGNGPKVLEEVDMVADDLVIDEGGWTCGKDGQSVPVSQGMPTVRVKAITVGGRKS